jgi:outer membrane protein
MQQSIKLLIIVSLLLFSRTSHADNKIAYIDIDFIISNSYAGKSISKYLENNNKLKIEKFEVIEKKLKDEEDSILSQRNILKREEFDNKVEILREKITDYKKNKTNVLNKLNSDRITLTKKLLEEINPILANYSKDKSLSIIIDKKNVVIGKKDLDITNEILKLLNEKIKEIEIK